MGIESYRDLDAWKLAMELAAATYLLVPRLPSEERFALGVQIRRAACSIPANVAEGHARGSTAEYIRSLLIAQGSLKELETHLLVAQRVGFFTEADIAPALELADREGRVLSRLIQSLRERLA